MSRPYGTKDDIRSLVMTERGPMLVFTVMDWVTRTRTLIFRRLAMWSLLVFILYVVCYVPMIVIFDLLFSGDVTCMSFVYLTVLFVVLITFGTFLVYSYRVSKPPAGVYANGIGLIDGTFLPYLTMTGVARDRRYGLLKTDQVVFHTGSTDEEGDPWAGKTPRLPFEFLRMDGLMAVIDILANDTTRGAPLMKGPELIIYGPGGAIR
jgi:hypothetical protein